MSGFERNLGIIIDTFHKYSRKQGNDDTLNKQEFKDLVKNELPNFLKCESRKEAEIQDIMEDLDTNQDQQLSFEEVFILFARLINATHEKMHEEGHRGKDHKHGSGLGEGDKGKGC